MSKILGISAGRKSKTTETVVKSVLEGTGEPFELISLSGKLIRPCEACNGCVKTNRCVLRDDFLPVIDKMYNTEAIVFGAPTYWDHINAKAQAFWERVCFSGRHNSLFPLKGKPAAIVAVDGIGDGRHVIRDLKLYFEDAGIKLAGSVPVQGEYACFTCGFGDTCKVGGFHELYPDGTPITLKNTPSPENQYPHKKNVDPCDKDVLPKSRKLGVILKKQLAVGNH